MHIYRQKTTTNMQRNAVTQKQGTLCERAQRFPYQQRGVSLTPLQRFIAVKHRTMGNGVEDSKKREHLVRHSRLCTASDLFSLACLNDRYTSISSNCRKTAPSLYRRRYASGVTPKCWRKKRIKVDASAKPAASAASFTLTPSRKSLVASERRFFSIYFFVRIWICPGINS